ncbi:MAG: cytochrome c3 family protein [Syntrophothermus sp.]
MKKFLLLILLFPFIGFAQISPGDLSSAHSKLEGISNCTKCHELGEQINNKKCLTCHQLISKSINENFGYHSSSDVKSKNCSLCHNEHHGRGFKIINFNNSKFNHSKTKFLLAGKHLKLECKDCHQNKFIKDSNLKKKKNTFLGLGTSCLNCHEDFHQNTLSSNCENCHSTESFNSVKFDHNKSSFRLTGAHQKVECIKCHFKEKRNGKSFQRFKGIVFSSCINCHKDVHNNKLGSSCQNCHQTNSFKNINTGSFDHNKTNFKLIGKHSVASCKACHKNDLNSKPAHNKCSNCHEDYHKGELIASNKMIRECNECHSEFGFNQTSYNIENHNLTDFKLEGSHLAIPCNSCHKKNDRWTFKFTEKNCINCHINIHGNELSEKYSQCSSCHNVEKWKIISFDHSKTKFSLLGKHQNIYCNKCHTQTLNGKTKFIFSSLNSNCETCHEDIHIGQFKKDGDSGCERCHSFNDWKPINFNHDETKFPLKGAHSKIECKVCHKLENKDSKTFIKYKIEKIKCADCHS